MPGKYCECENWQRNLVPGNGGGKEWDEQLVLGLVGPLTGSRNSDDREAAWGIGGSFQPANSVSHFSVIEYAQPPGQGCRNLPVLGLCLG